MQKQRCNEICKLGKIFVEGKNDPVPAWFVVHAKECVQCTFSLSYHLAAVEALLTTNRVVKNSDCLPQEAFFLLLLGAMTTLRVNQETGAPLDKERARTIIFSSPENALFFHECLSHTSHCMWCEEYHAALFEAMVKAQERYEAVIRNSGTVVPVTESSARLIFASEIKRENVKRRPN